MKKFITTNAVSALIIIALVNLFGQPSCSTKVASKESPNEKTRLMGQAEAELKADMRKLWFDHVYWTRNVIFCLVDGLPGTEEAVSRLLQNQVAIGNAFKTYYGNEAGKKLTNLLYPHVIIATDVIKAALDGKKEALADANKRWYNNSDDIAEFLSKVNPAWKLGEMKTMMHSHLRLTAEEVDQRIKKNYKADVVAFDKVQVHVLEMADMFSTDICQQFPEKFSTNTILEVAK